MKLPRLRSMRRAIQLRSRRDYLLLLSGVVMGVAAFGIISFVSHPHEPLKPASSGITIPWIPPTVRHWQGPIDEMAKKYSVDPNAIAIIMTLESGGYAKANSGEATGLMQITPLTAKDIASKYLKKPQPKYNLEDPRTSIEFGTAYLAYLRDIFGTAAQGPSWDSTMELVAAGYNGGPGAANDLEKGVGLTDTQTVVYSRDAFNMWRERHAKASPTYERWLERGGSTLVDAAKASQQ